MAQAKRSAAEYATQNVPREVAGRPALFQSVWRKGVQDQQVQKVRGTKVGVMIRMLKSGRFAKRRPKSCKPEVDRRQGHSNSWHIISFLNPKELEN
jgi:hypothetical protein